MKSHKREGFTLIELLVVIAIIAILAAILFPVFAQAKRAAKGAVALSDAKQMALAELMYTNDYDDAFTPVVETEKAYSGIYYWTYLLQPYIKNWGIFADPTGPNVLAGSSDNSGGFNAFALYGLWGAPPERIDSAIATTAADFTFGQTPLGKQMTGGQLWYYDGIMGVGMGGKSWWSTWYYKGGGGSGMSDPQGVPSLTTTSVANPADQVMCAQSGEADFMWENNGNGGAGDFFTHADTPDNFDTYFSGCGSNAYGCNATICGPIARQRDTSGPQVGFYPWGPPISGGTAGAAQAGMTQLPTGLTVWSGTDGHTKATPWRQLMGATIQINGGANLAIKAFWPTGS